MLSILKKIEEYVLSADEKVTELKSFIYEKLDPKTTFEITPESHNPKRIF